MKTMLEDIKKLIGERFTEEDIKFYQEKFNELKEEVLKTEKIEEKEVRDYTFAMIVKELQNIDKTDLGLLYLILE